MPLVTGNFSDVAERVSKDYWFDHIQSSLKVTNSGLFSIIVDVSDETKVIRPGESVTFDEEFKKFSVRCKTKGGDSSAFSVELDSYKAAYTNQIKPTKFQLPIGISICQNQTPAYTVAQVKEEIDTVIAAGYQEINFTIHEYKSGTEWVRTRTVPEIYEITEYIKGRGIPVNLKIHTIQANDAKTAGTLVVNAFQAAHLAFITELSNSNVRVQYVYDFNECFEFYEDAAWVTYINSCIDLLKNIGKAGISFSEMPGCDRCLPEIKSNLQVMGINAYPAVSSEENAQFVTIEEMVEAIETTNPKEWVEAQNRLYPDADITISECGCPYYWENYVAPAVTSYGGKTVTNSGGVNSARYLDATLRAFKKCNIKSYCWWYLASGLTQPVQDMIKYWKGV